MGFSSVVCVGCSSLLQLLVWVLLSWFAENCAEPEFSEL